MDTILSSLNALVEKLGGDATDNKLIVDALNDISAKYGGESGNKLIVDALNDIVDNYSGGVDFAVREITFVNRLSKSIVGVTFTIASNTNSIYQLSTQHIDANQTKTFRVVGSGVLVGKYSQQFLIFKSSASATSAVSEEVDGVEIIAAANNYYILRIPATATKDITITIS